MYLGLDMELGQLMAVKQLGLSHMGPGAARGSEHEAAVRRVEKEVNFYRRLSHPHIVRYLVRDDANAQDEALPAVVRTLPCQTASQVESLRAERGQAAI